MSREEKIGHRHLSLGAMSAALSIGTTTSVDLVSAALQRARDSSDIFVTLIPEALADAEASDLRRANGKPLSPIDGVPTAVKDVIETRGVRTTMASNVYEDYVPENDAAIVAKLRSAGAVFIGKTNATEFSYGICGDVGAFGVVRNPHDARLLAGGSSSGSAASVAAGIVPYSIGSDTAGSVRVPAALCGVVGMKPTLGAFDTAGVYPLAPSFDTLGLLATCVDDVEMVLDAVGLEVAQSAAAQPCSFQSLDDVAGNVSDDTVRSTYVKCCAAVDAKPARLAEALGGDVDFASLYNTIRAREAYLIHASAVSQNPELYQPATLQKILAGQEVDEAQYLKARAEVDQVRAIAEMVFAESDVLLTPAVPIQAPDACSPAVSALLSSTSVIWNVLGWPSVTVPIWVEGVKLPQAIQLSVRPGGDRLLLRAAEHLAACQPLATDTTFNAGDAASR